MYLISSLFLKSSSFLMSSFVLSSRFVVVVVFSYTLCSRETACYSKSLFDFSLASYACLLYSSSCFFNSVYAMVRISLFLSSNSDLASLSAMYRALLNFANLSLMVCLFDCKGGSKLIRMCILGRIKYLLLSSSICFQSHF